MKRETPAVPGNLLEVDNLEHAFGGLQVLTGVSFAVQEGGLNGLIGPNGSGKTTCFNIVSGFLRPRAGIVRFGGRDITSDSIQERSRAGLVRTFQTPQVFAQMTVHENLLVGSYKQTSSGAFANMVCAPSARRDKEQMRARARDVAAKFELSALLDRPAGELPAGQQRIVELARAYVGSPRLLLLDEPSSGLSVSEIAVLREWILTLHREGMTLLLVSHDMGLMTVAETVCVLYFGKIIASGTMEGIHDDASVREAYLG